MLSTKIVAALNALPYQPNAEWEVNILPFGSVYWKDEMPDIKDIFDRPDDMTILFAMFGIRLKLWDGKLLKSEEQQLWDSVKHQVPNWALFKRVNLSNEQKRAREEAERQVGREFEPIRDENGGTQE